MTQLSVITCSVQTYELQDKSHEHGGINCNYLLLVSFVYFSLELYLQLVTAAGKQIKENDMQQRMWLDSVLGLCDKGSA